MNFQVDPSIFTCVTIKKEWGMFDHKETLTNEELIKVIKGQDRCSSTSTADHPDFEKLREQLGQEGYIRIQRGWWNGDTVLKPFSLNGAKFKKGEQFPCGSAMAYTIEYKQMWQKSRKNNAKNQLTTK